MEENDQFKPEIPTPPKAAEPGVMALRECPVAVALHTHALAVRPADLPMVRTLQIEADGAFGKRPAKAKIRLIGRWLERAGFRPGDRVCIVCTAPGVIELRSPDAILSEAGRH